MNTRCVPVEDDDGAEAWRRFDTDVGMPGPVRIDPHAVYRIGESFVLPGSHLLRCTAAAAAAAAVGKHTYCVPGWVVAGGSVSATAHPLQVVVTQPTRPWRWLDAMEALLRGGGCQYAALDAQGVTGTEARALAAAIDKAFNGELLVAATAGDAVALADVADALARTWRAGHRHIIVTRDCDAVSAALRLAQLCGVEGGAGLVAPSAAEDPRLLTGLRLRPRWSSSNLPRKRAGLQKS